MIHRYLPNWNEMNSSNIIPVLSDFYTLAILLGVLFGLIFINSIRSRLRSRENGVDADSMTSQGKKAYCSFYKKRWLKPPLYYGIC